jgi:hypothetical protein
MDVLNSLQLEIPFYRGIQSMRQSLSVNTVQIMYPALPPFADHPPKLINFQLLQINTIDKG